jgi:hypothetical protein
MEDIKLQKSVSESQTVTNGTIFPDLHRLNQAYWFRFILTEGDITTELRYKLFIRFVKPRTQTSVLVMINRLSDVYINDQLPDLPVDCLACETGKIFYPLIVEIDTGMNYLGICNQEQINKRWDEIKPQVKRYFSGEEVERYLRRLEEVVSTKKSLDEIFEKELLIKFYFQTVYMNYTSRFETQNEISFPVGNYAPVAFDVKSCLQKTLNKEGFKEISQDGVETKKNVWPDADQERENTYKADFTLDAETNIIKEAVAEWHFQSSFPKRIQIILFPLRQPLSDTLLIEEDEQEKTKGKGFFSRLFGS